MTKQANPQNKPKTEKVAKKTVTPRPRPRVPEADPIQEYWSRIISPCERHVETKFKGGGPGGVTVLRKDVPRLWRTVKNRKGVCCVYFVKGERHFLAMVSEKELNKMSGTIGDLDMTNHAKTLAYGMKAANKRKGVPNFSVVDACFGFWFNVCKDDGLEYTFKSCANYFNDGSGRNTRQLAKDQEKSLLAALDTVSAIPKDCEADSESDSGSVIDLRDTDNALECEIRKPPVQKKCEEAGASVSGQQKQHQPATGKMRKDGKFGTDSTATAAVVLDSATKPQAPPCSRPTATKPQAPRCPRPAATKPQAPPCPRPAATTAGMEPSVCLARMPIFGTRCNLDRFGDSPFCIAHWPLWRGKDSPIWGLPSATTVSDFRSTICLAWINDTGLRCSNERYGPSRWCTKHLSEWHGKDSPGWRPCPP